MAVALGSSGTTPQIIISRFKCIAKFVKLVPCIVMVSLLPLLPESPCWLLNHHHVEDAQEALRRLLGKDLSSDDIIVQNELKSILGAIEIERRSHIPFKEVILRRDRSGHLKRLLLGCGGQFIQQLGGINALNYYFPIILTKSLGLSTLLARILTGANATSYMISSALAFWLIERTGRRSLMMTGLGLQGFAYVMVALSVGLLATTPHGVRAHSHFQIQLLTNDSTVGLNSNNIPLLLLRRLRLHMGHGPLGLPSRNQLPRHAHPGRRRRHSHKLALRLRLHTIHAHGYQEHRIPFLHHFRGS